VRKEWSSEYPPEDHFEKLTNAVVRFTGALSDQIDPAAVTASFQKSVNSAVKSMLIEYEEPDSAATPMQQSRAVATPLDELFRDVHE
jgi:hypothetical protein